MVYGKILFNNIKEYTPSWIKTVPYSQTTKPTFVRKTQVISKFGADPRVKRGYKWLQNNVQKNPPLWQVFIFLSAFVLYQTCYWPWLKAYQMNNSERSLNSAIAREKEYKRKKKAEEDAAAEAEAKSESE